MQSKYYSMLRETGILAPASLCKKIGAQFRDSGNLDNQLWVNPHTISAYDYLVTSYTA